MSGLLLNEADDLVTRDTNKVEVLRPSSPQASPTRSPRDLVPRGRVQGGEGLSVVKGD